MKTRCTRVLDSLGDSRALAALQSHVESCAECRALVEAHARLRETRPPSLDASAVARIREAGRTELAARPRAHAWWLSAFVVCALALGTGIAGAVLMPRGNLASPPRQIGVAALLVGAILSGSWAGLSPERRWRTAALGAALAASAAVVAGGSGVFPAWCGGFWEAGLRCARAVVLYSVPCSIAALLLLRSAAFSAPRALATGLASGAGGALALHPHCPIGEASHLALFHVLPWFAVAAALLLVQRRLHPRTFAP
jgi:Negative regulator of sigma F